MDEKSPRFTQGEERDPVISSWIEEGALLGIDTVALRVSQMSAAQHDTRKGQRTYKRSQDIQIFRVIGIKQVSARNVRCYHAQLFEPLKNENTA